jgi:uridine phosphorylase
LRSLKVEVEIKNNRDMRIIPESELIINSDGSAFHLHITPDQLSDKIVMMGDPDRVTMTASFFDTIECDVQSREFHTVTGTYKGKRITALSHGIGTDNIDIVVTELDALANIDFKTRTVKDEFKQLTMVRIGTSGGMQPHCPVGSYVVSEKSIGFDGLIHFYDNSKNSLDYFVYIFKVSSVSIIIQTVTYDKIVWNFQCHIIKI